MLYNILVPVTKEGRIDVNLQNPHGYKKYVINDEKISAKSDIENGNGDIMALVRDNGIDTVICAMVEKEQRRDFAISGVTLYAGNYGIADDVVTNHVNGEKVLVPDTARAIFGIHYSPCAHNGEY